MRSKIKNRVGEIHTNSTGENFTIIKYRGNKDLDVQFEDGTIVKNKGYRHVTKKSIKNPNVPNVYGVGYMGKGKYLGSIEGKSTKECSIWRSILARCYDKYTQKKHPSYIGCSVDERWHNFQNFAKWYEENYNPNLMEGWHIDKDILIKGNRIYSDKNCCFIPKELNHLFKKRINQGNSLPTGVHKNREKFVASFSRGKGFPEYIGTFNTPEEAFQAYKIAKETYIKELAHEWRPLIGERIYNIIYHYKIEITD